MFSGREGRRNRRPTSEEQMTGGSENSAPEVGFDKMCGIDRSGEIAVLV